MSMFAVDTGGVGVGVVAMLNGSAKGHKHYPNHIYKRHVIMDKATTFIQYPSCSNMLLK